MTTKVSTTKKITAKLLEEKLKKSWGTLNFANYLGITEQEFMRNLDKTFHGPVAQSYKRRIKNNNKNIKQQLNRRASSKKTTCFI